MSGAVENKVVSIKFDNSIFASKVSETLGMLQKLKGGLNLGGATKSMDELDTAAKRFDMSNVTNAMSATTAKAAAMGAAIGVVLGGIVSKAAAAGSQIIKSLSIAPLMDGFREYETNMNSIQTILANTESKGTSLEQVNSALDTMNAYSDKTIYNFSEMAKNVGTFTAAGLGLDESTSAIKGIANLAAISGSSSEQASTAMYQLSQALASGTVKAQDWMSVTNAGMGGEIFQKSLFETAKALGTIKDVPMGETFDEWKDKGNTFKGSLEDGWITSDVLSTTLQGFTGDLSEAQLMAIGYTEEQAKAFMKLGKTGQAAAQDVKTFTQLISTVKESVGSGWSSTARLVIGDFEEAKKLFTSINNFVGGIIGRSADARNKMLTEWKNFGGREILLGGLRTALVGLVTLVKPIGEAFRSIFPKKTSGELLLLTIKFKEFTEKLILGKDTMEKVKNAFTGFFSAIKIGIEIVKGIFNVVADVVKAILPAGDGVLDFASKTGLSIANLRKKLVEGGGIADFFKGMSDKILSAIDSIKQFTSKIKGIFGGFEGVDTSGIESKLGIFERIKDIITGVIPKIKEALSGFAEHFSGMRTGLLKNFELGDAAGLINAGLIGGIFLAVRSLIKKLGDLVDEGTGFIEGIKDIFGGVTDTLQAMQLKLKADALLRIAIAMGVLSVSLLVLSGIDGDALSKALGAMAAGFGQLAAVMVILTKANVSGLGLLSIALGMTGLAASMLILAFAMKVMASMDWDELKRGLIGVGVGLALLVAATLLLGNASGPMARAAVSMTLMGIALNILALAVKQFGGMEWDVMKQGLMGVGIALAGLVLATNLIDGSKMISAGLGIVAISVAMLILAKAVESFGSMEWDVMKQGLMGVGAALGIIVLSMMLVDGPRMLAAGVGLVAVGLALNIIALAVKQFGGMDWDAMKNGIGGIAAMMLILVVATNAMSGALVGALAMVVVAGAISILGKVLGELATLSLGEVGIALLAIAGVLLVIGLAAAAAMYVLPGLIAMALALPLIGLGFGLMGAGAYLAAEAFRIVSETGGEAFEVFKKVVVGFVKMLPGLAKDLATFVLKFAKGFIDGLPPVLESIGKALEMLLDVIVKIIPKLAKVIGLLIGAIIQIIRDHVPDLIAAAFEIISALLKGIDEHAEEFGNRAVSIITTFIDVLTSNMGRIVEAGVNFITAFMSALVDNRDKIVTAVIDLIVAFVEVIAEQLPKIQEAAANLIITFITGLTGQMARILAAGTELLVQFMFGITSNVLKIVDAVVTIITTFISALASSAVQIVAAGATALASFLQGITDGIMLIVAKGTEIVVQMIQGITNAALTIVQAGADALVSFLEGITNNILTVVAAGTEVIVKLIKGFTDAALLIIAAGADALVKFLKGITDNILDVVTTGGEIIAELLTGIGNAVSDLITAGADALLDFLQGITDNLDKVLQKGKDIVLEFLEGVASNSLALATGAADLIIQFMNDLSAAIDQRAELFRNAGKRLAFSIVDGLTFGLASKVQSVVDAASNLASSAINAVKGLLKSRSPSKVFHKIGQDTGQGFADGLEESAWYLLPSAERLARGVVTAFRDTIQDTLFTEGPSMAIFDKLTPVVAPVLDLSELEAGAGRITDLLAINPITADASYARARYVLHTESGASDTSSSDDDGVGGSVTYNQYISSPKSLTTSEIYRDSKSLLARKKEELKIG
jgi:tape measure domain-containing protein